MITAKEARSYRVNSLMVKNGVEKIWHENGKLASEYHYQDGIKHGIQKGWYEDGQLWYEDQYKNGLLHGIQKGWLKDGKPLHESHYFCGDEVTEEEFEKYELIVELAGIAAR